MALLLAALLAASGCFGGSSPKKTYYSIQYPAQQTWKYEKPRYPYMVRIRRCESALAYDRQELVYRSNPHEFQYYWYRLWAAKPRKMMRQLINQHLRHTNLFAEVTLEIMESLPDYDLQCDVLAIEELNSTKEEWYAHLSMRMALVRFEDGAQVWEYNFDERKSVYNRQPVYVVRALSEMTEAQMSRAFADLDRFLSDTTGIPAPAGGPGVAPTPQTNQSTDTGPPPLEDTRPEEKEGDEGENDKDTEPKATLKKR